MWHEIFWKCVHTQEIVHHPVTWCVHAAGPSIAVFSWLILGMVLEGCIKSSAARRAPIQTEGAYVGQFAMMYIFPTTHQGKWAAVGRGVPMLAPLEPGLGARVLQRGAWPFCLLGSRSSPSQSQLAVASFFPAPTMETEFLSERRHSPGSDILSRLNISDNEPKVS